MRLTTLVLPALFFAAAAALADDSSTAAKSLDIHWIDTEGGAATLIITPVGESILVDTGNPGERDAGRIAKTAKQAGLARIDHVISTHWHRVPPPARRCGARNVSSACGQRSKPSARSTAR